MLQKRKVNITYSIQNYKNRSMFIHVPDIKIHCFWSRRSDENMQYADEGSKRITTDEWGLSPESYNYITKHFNFYPDTDAFASEIMTKCAVFYSKLPDRKTSGVDFFLQELSTQRKYFACPPVKLIHKAWRTIVNTPGLSILFLVPNWRSNAFYAAFLDHDDFKPCIKKYKVFQASFVSASENCLFKGETPFSMLAMMIVT